MKDEPTPLRAARNRLSARLCCLAVALSLALVGCTPAVDASPWENATATAAATVVPADHLQVSYRVRGGLSEMKHVTLTAVTGDTTVAELAANYERLQAAVAPAVVTLPVPDATLSVGLTGTAVSDEPAPQFHKLISLDDLAANNDLTRLAR